MIRLLCFVYITLIMSAVHAQTGQVYEVQNDSLLDHLEFRSLLEDTQGNLWLGTRGNGLYKLTNDTLYRLNLEGRGIDFSGAASISVDSEGRLIFTGRGVLLNNNEEWLMLDAGKLKSTVVFNAFAPDADHLFFAGNKGLTIMRGEGDTSYLEGDSAPPHPVVHDVVLDKHGSLWIATRKTGLQVWHEGDTKWTGYYLDANCRKLLESDNGDVWVGSTMGVIRYDQKSQEVNLLKAGELLLPEFEEPDGTIWFSSESLGVWTYYEGNWVKQSPAGSFDVIRRRDGTVWSATSSGLIQIKPKR